MHDGKAEGKAQGKRRFAGKAHAKPYNKNEATGGSKNLKAHRNSGFGKSGRKPHENEGYKKTSRKPRENETYKKTGYKPRENEGYKKTGYKSRESEDYKKTGRKPHESETYKKTGYKSRENETYKKTGYKPRENEGFKKSGRAPSRSERHFEKPRRQSHLNGKARGAAWDTVDRVLIDGGYSAISLSDVLNELTLDERDKRLCTRIVYLTLEKLNYIDFALGYFIKEPEKLPPTLINLLRISAAQLLFLDRVPSSAVVDEAVSLARKRGYEELTPLVNGALRSFVRKKDSVVFPKKEDNLRAYLSICGSASLELVDTLIENFGEEKAEKIIMFSDRGFSMTIRRNMMLLTRIQFEELVKSKPWKAESAVLPYVYRVSGTSDISKDQDFRDGLFSIQGEGSMLAALAVNADLGMNILDCCAAPGGKTMLMAEQMQGTGRVQAWDVHEKRVQLIRAAAERLRLYNVRPMARDASVFRENLVSSMDAVLLDAPCTGTGVLSSKPESKYRFNLEGLDALREKQGRLLETVCRYVKNGGRLVYSTCSILPEENSEQIKSFLNRHNEFKMLPFQDDFPESLKHRASPYGMQLMPGEDGMQEGFFIAAMVKTSDE